MSRPSLGLGVFALSYLLTGCLPMIPYESTFDQGDCDNDDLLSYDELSRTYTFKVNGAGMTSATRPQFTRADKNQDDKLNFTEFTGLFFTENITDVWVDRNCH